MPTRSSNGFSPPQPVAFDIRPLKARDRPNARIVRPSPPPACPDREPDPPGGVGLAPCPSSPPRAAARCLGLVTGMRQAARWKTARHPHASTRPARRRGAGSRTRRTLQPTQRLAQSASLSLPQQAPQLSAHGRQMVVALKPLGGKRKGEETGTRGVRRSPASWWAGFEPSGCTPSGWRSLWRSVESDEGSASTY